MADAKTHTERVQKELDDKPLDEIYSLLESAQPEDLHRETQPIHWFVDDVKEDVEKITSLIENEPVNHSDFKYALGRLMDDAGALGEKLNIPGADSYHSSKQMVLELAENNDFKQSIGDESIIEKMVAAVNYQPGHEGGARRKKRRSTRRRSRKNRRTSKRKSNDKRTSKRKGHSKKSRRTTRDKRRR